MRILVTANLFPPHTIGGHEIVCGRVTEALRSRGYDITVLTSRWAPDGLPTNDGAIRILHLLYPDLVPRRGPMILARRYSVQEKNYELTRRVIDEVAPDIVYAWGMGYITLGPAFAAQDAGLKVVFDNGDGALIRQSARGLARRMAFAMMGLVPRRSMGVHELDLSFGTFVSEALKQMFLGASLPVSHWPVIHRGIPREWTRNRCIAGSGRAARILFAGRLEAFKGVDVVIGAMARMAKEELGRGSVLDLVGTGEEGYVRRLKARVAALGLDHCVRFLGRKAPEKMLGVYDETDIMVFPSVGPEGLSVGRLEAMARGVALVSTDTGGGREVVRNEENALVVPPGDEAATAEAVLRLIQDPRLMQRISDGAVQTIRERFLFENAIEEIEGYLSLAAGGDSRRSAMGRAG